jgi:hypothetical protein
MGSEQRKDPRAPSYAKALLIAPPAPGYIRDLSRSGCQVAFMQAVDVKKGDLITVRVIAEHDPSIAPFLVRLHVRWMRQDSIWIALGGEVEPPDDAQTAAAFDKLVAYYTGYKG